MWAENPSTSSRWKREVYWCSMRGNHKLVFVHRNEDSLSISKTDIAEYPICLLVDSEQRYCFVASLWSRTVSRFKLPSEPNGTVKRAGKCTLPFPPKELCFARDEKQVVVAGAFEAAIAVLDSHNLKVTAHHELPGHNIGGMLVMPESGNLIMTQQELSPLAHTTQDDVHWGNLMSNLLVTYPLSALSDPNGAPANHRTVTQLGRPGRAAADPGRHYHGRRRANLRVVIRYP